MGMLNQLYNLHGLGTSKHKKIAMTICACAIQNPHLSVCMLQFLDNQPVPFASPARFSTGGLCSASKGKRWLPVETSLSPTGSSACVASSSYIHNNFSDMAAALAGHLSFARMPCSCVVFIWKSRNKQFF